jgi:hypothetical protein
VTVREPKLCLMASVLFFDESFTGASTVPKNAPPHDEHRRILRPSPAAE